MSLNIPNLERNKFLAPFTTYKIGGPSDLFVEVHTIDELTDNSGDTILNFRNLHFSFVIPSCRVSAGIYNAWDLHTSDPSVVSRK